MSPQVLCDDFQLNADSGVWTHPSHRGFAYSDGKHLERDILTDLRRTQDRTIFSEPLRRKIHNWPTLYHLSSRRHLLLRHLNLPHIVTQSDGPQLSVLELGAGCGAITRYLGELGAEVWAVEGSHSRAACVASRTADLPNVRVLCGDFQEIQLDRKFDIVTLIGVLEYSPVFFKGQHPLLRCLEQARSWLKPDGTLLLAIENQLGLKYFCGAPEDHTGKPFDGIQDLYTSSGPRTCGRTEMIRVLSQVGFTNVNFHYPFPDYKLPAWVFTQQAFETEHFDPTAILRLLEPSHDGVAAAYPADQRLIWPTLHRNGLLPDLANSFLILAGSAESKPLAPQGLLAAGYALERRACFNTQTLIRTDELGEITVQKAPLCSACPPPGIEIEHVPGLEPYRRGEQLEQQIVLALQCQGLDGALPGLSRWIQYLLDSAILNQDPSDPYASLLKPEFFDCQPRNLIDSRGVLQQIDVEWRYVGALPLRNHILRYLCLLSSGERKTLRRILTAKTPLALQLAERLRVPVSKMQYEQYRHWQHTLNRWIVGEKRGAERPSFWKRMIASLQRPVPTTA